MPRTSLKVPGYCLHRASGRAVVRINGRDRYLGKHGSPESHEAYEREIAEWRASQPALSAGMSAVNAASMHLTVSEVLLRYKAFADGYYVKDGKPSKEYLAIKYALRPLRKLYGNTRIRDFGPLALKAVRQHMLDVDLSRKLINARINRIKRFFKWSVSEELCPSSVFESLRTVDGLRYGRTTARETEPVKPVSDVWVEAILPFVSRQVAAMIRLQRLTGMRPCEVVLMRACDIDMTGAIWVYEPYDHKNRWRGHRRLIPVGPKAQQIVREFPSTSTTAFLFSPAAAEMDRNAARRAKRKTPMTPSQAARKPKAMPKRAKRERYDVEAYRRAIKYGIKKANRERAEALQVPQWYPLQLRHSRATEVRKRFGLEAAQVSLGHAHANVTEVYAERNLELALDIARQSG